MKNLWLAAVFGGLSLAGASAASASTCTGNCGTLGADGVVTAPPGGTTYGYVSTAGGLNGVGQISGVGGTNGSEQISDVFSANAADPLNFYFNYVTTDGSGSFSDYAFAELLTAGDAHVAWLFTGRTTPSGDTSPGFGLPSNDSTLTPSSSAIVPGSPTWSPVGSGCYAAGCGYTGWIKSDYSIADAGAYKVRFGVSNYGDTSYNSGLAFAGLQVGGVDVGGGGGPIGSAVPEPATWAKMIMGFGMAGALLRRRHHVPAAA